MSFEAGHFRGNYRETKVVEFRRYFSIALTLLCSNNNFHFDEDSALHRARDANISEATVASLKIKKEADGRILLDADELFLSEALHRVSPWARPGGNQGPAFSLGNLNRNPVTRHQQACLPEQYGRGGLIMYSTTPIQPSVARTQ